ARIGIELLAVAGTQPTVQFIVRSESRVWAASTDDGAGRNLVVGTVCRGFTSGQHGQSVAEQTTWQSLHHEAFQIATPEAGVNHFRTGGHQGRDFSVVLTGAQFR